MVRLPGSPRISSAPYEYAGRAWGPARLPHSLVPAAVWRNPCVAFRPAGHSCTMTGSQRDPSPSADAQVVERLVPAWLAEAARSGSPTAEEDRRGWEQRRLSSEAARELADWVTARVTDTAFNADKAPDAAGPARISVADKAAVHRWLAAQGHTL